MLIWLRWSLRWSSRIRVGSGIIILLLLRLLSSRRRIIVVITSASVIVAFDWSIVIGCWWCVIIVVILLLIILPLTLLRIRVLSLICRLLVSGCRRVVSVAAWVWLLRWLLNWGSRCCRSRVAVSLVGTNVSRTVGIGEVVFLWTIQCFIGIVWLCDAVVVIVSSRVWRAASITWRWRRNWSCRVTVLCKFYRSCCITVLRLLLVSGCRKVVTVARIRLRLLSFSVVMFFRSIVWLLLRRCLIAWLLLCRLLIIWLLCSRCLITRLLGRSLIVSLLSCCLVVRLLGRSLIARLLLTIGWLLLRSLIVLSRLLIIALLLSSIVLWRSFIRIASIRVLLLDTYLRWSIVCRRRRWRHHWWIISRTVTSRLTRGQSFSWVDRKLIDSKISLSISDWKNGSNSSLYRSLTDYWRQLDSRRSYCRRYWWWWRAWHCPWQ